MFYQIKSNQNDRNESNAKKSNYSGTSVHVIKTHLIWMKRFVSFFSANLQHGKNLNGQRACKSFQLLQASVGSCSIFQVFSHLMNEYHAMQAHVTFLFPVSCNARLSAPFLLCFSLSLLFIEIFQLVISLPESICTLHSLLALL